MMFDSFTSNYQQGLFKGYKMSKFQMMFGVNLFSCFFTLWSAPLSTFVNLAPCCFALWVRPPCQPFVNFVPCCFLVRAPVDPRYPAFYTHFYL